MSESTTKVQFDETDSAGQLELKRAYLHVSFGQYDQAIEACDRAAQAAPEHYLPATLRGSFEMAAGRVRDALGTLRPVTRRHPDEPLPKIYFAEACFLAGRHRQGLRALEQAETSCQKKQQKEQQNKQQESSAEHYTELIDRLRQIWQSVEPTKVPPPLVVELADDAES